MTTKSQHRAYLQSPVWRQRREDYFANNCGDCAKCGLPRWLAIVAYDQDIHIHHLTYANIGHEHDEDLQPLCRRCHEVVTFRHTALHEVARFQCISCGKNPSWDRETRACEECKGRFYSQEIINNLVDETDRLREAIDELRESGHERHSDEIEQIKRQYAEDLERELGYEEKREVARQREEMFIPVERYGDPDTWRDDDTDEEEDA